MQKKRTYQNDQQLAEACASDDQRAQYLFYDRFVDVMYNTAYRYCFNKEMTEDILQIAFARAFAAIRQFDARKGNLKAWLRRICINTTMDVLKKEAKWEAHWDGDWDIADEKINFNHYEVAFILQLIERLPEEQRTIFNLYEIEGYAHEEIAEMIGINVNSCRVYLSRAKQKLRKAIKMCEGV